MNWGNSGRKLVFGSGGRLLIAVIDTAITSKVEHSVIQVGRSQANPSFPRC